ncbi:MAG: beta strand repeat-containing protein [Ginsengibacter sp.]
MRKFYAAIFNGSAFKGPKWILCLFVVLLGMAPARSFSQADPASFIASPVNNTQISLSAISNASTDNIVVVYNLSGTFTAPANGTAPSAVGAALAGGTIVYNGSAAGLSSHTGLNPNTQYFYKAFSYDASNNYSAGITSNATTCASVFTVSGGGDYCSGGSGVDITLSGSETGVVYQLKNGSTKVGAAVAGTGAVLNFNNITAAGRYTVDASNSGNSCTVTMNGSADVIVNPVLPVSVSISSNLNTICVGQTVTFTATPTNGGLAPTFQWRIDGFNRGSASTSSSISIDTFTLSHVVTVSMVSNASPCATGSPAISNPGVTITVNPTPAVTAPSNQIYCNGQSVSSIALTGSPSGVKYDITGGASIGLANQSGVTAIPAFTATNNGTTAITATVTITPSANGCTGTGQSFTITVNPTPAVTAPSNQIYCNGQSVSSIALTGSPAGVKYDITGGASVGLANQSGVTAIPAFTATNNGTTAITATVTITPSANGCTGTGKTFNITVNPTLVPSVTISASSTSICSGASVTFTPTPTNGGSPLYQWQKSTNGGASWTTVGTSNGTYTTNTLANGDIIRTILNSSVTCATPTTATSNAVTITVYSGVPAKPDNITTTAPSSICPVATGYTFSVPEVANATGYVWNFPDPGWIITSGAGTNSIAVTVSGTASNGNNLPVTVQAQNACGLSTASNSVTFKVNKFAAVDAGADQSVCTGSSINLAGTLLGNAGTGTWSIISPAGSGNFSNVNTSTASATFTPTISSGQITLQLAPNKPGGTCSGGVTTDQIIITVNQPSSAPTSISGTTTLCNGATTTLTAVGGTLGTGANYQWGTGSVVGANPIAGATSVSYTTPALSSNTTYWVYITNTTGPCSATTTGVAQLVTVNQPSVAPTSISGITTLCNNATTTTTLTAVGGTLGTGANYQWGTGSVVGANPIAGATSVSYTTPALSSNTTYWVYITNTTGPCLPTTTSGVTQLVTVNQPSVAPKSISGTTTLCNNGSATTTLTAVGGTLGTGANYQWGTGSVVGANPISGATSVSYTTPALSSNTTYWVYIANTTGPCSATTTGVTQLVMVNQPPSITTEPADTAVCASFPVSFSVSATGTGLTYQWYKNGNPLSNGGTVSGATSATLHISQAATGDIGDYYVKVMGAGPCGSVNSAAVSLSVNQSITINTQPAASQTICENSPVTFSVDASGNISDYQWRRNGTPIAGATGSSFSIVNVATTDEGNYDVIISGTDNSCSQAISTGAVLTVNSKSADPTSANATTPTICVGGSTTLNLVGGGGGTGEVIHWYSDAALTNSVGTGNALSVSPTVTTTYYGRYEDGGVCNYNSGSVSTIVTVNQKSANPTSANATTPTICVGGSTTLNLVGGGGGTGEVIHWYSNAALTNSVGTGNALSVSPTVTTTYYGRYEDGGVCNYNSGSISVIVTVTPLPVGGTLSPSVTTGLCAGSNGGTVTLSGETGLVARWEQSVNGGVSWAPVNSLNTTTTATALTYTNLTVSTLYRAVVQSGICAATAFSSNAVVAVTPPFIPTVTASPSTTICQGQPVTLITSSFSTLGSINQGDFSDANPNGWRVKNNGVEINFPANANNTVPNPWSETNGPKDFSGTTYGSQLGGKFAIVNGAQISTLETPIFSSIGKTSDTLSFYQAFNLTSDAIARIEISTDGGNTYNATLAQYNPPSTFGVTLNGFVNVKIPLTSYLGMANLRVRFVYSSTGASSWAIDNLNTAATYQPVINSWKGSDGTSYTGDTLIASPTDTTTYTILTSTGGCTTTTTSVTINVNKPPVIPAPPSVSAATCVGGSASINVNATGTALTYQWQISTDGGTTWKDITTIFPSSSYTGFKTATLNIATTTSDMADNLYRVIATAPNPCNISDTSEAVALQLKNVWTGTIDTDWNKGGNWSDGSVPGTSCPVVTIPKVISNNYPILSADGIKAIIISLQIDAKASAKITGNTMQLAGSITNNGIFDVTDGTVEFNGTTGTQNIAGSNFKNNIPGKNNTVKNLIISNNVNVANTTGDTLNITGLLSFSVDNTTLTTGDNLTLKSTKDNTASIGTLAANNVVSGQVEVERYLNIGTTAGTHPKSWQFLSTPAKGQSLVNSWMEGIGGITNTNSTGYGAQFTGTAGTTGYDGAPSIAPSVKSWDEGTGAWKEFANTGDLLYNPRGYFAFVRGDRSVATVSQPATPTTLRSKGTIFTHGQSMPVPGQTANNVFFSIGNPYPSAVDMTKILQTGTPDPQIQFIYVWSPLLNEGYGVGGWNTYIFMGDHYVNTNLAAVDGVLQSGQAFLMQEEPGSTTVTFNENAKVSSSRSDIAFREQSVTGKEVQLITNLLSIKTDGSTSFNDGTLQQFDQSYSGKIDRYDARKIMNTANNLAIKTSSGVNLVVERRMPLTEQDTIRYNMSSMARQNYRLEFKAQGLSSENLEGFVEDTYLNTRTPMNMEGTTNVDFAITSDKGSYAANRFRVVFKTAVVLPVKLISVAAVQQDENIRVNWKVENEKAVKQYVVEKATDGVIFKQAGIVAAANNEAGSSYQWLDDKAIPGDNYYRIRIEEQTGKISYSDVVKVSIPLGKPSIGIYPNPITDGIIHLQLINQPKGRYGLRLLNPLGQTIIAKQVEYAGGNATEDIKWDYHLAHGVYQLQVLKPDGKISVIKVMY